MTETDKRTLIVIAAFVSAFVLCASCFIIIFRLFVGSPEQHKEDIKQRQEIQNTIEYLEAKYRLGFVALDGGNSIYYSPIENKDIVVTVTINNGVYSDNYTQQKMRYDLIGLFDGTLGISTIIQYNAVGTPELSIFYYEDLINLADIVVDTEYDYVCYFYKVSKEDYLNIKAGITTEVIVDLEYKIINKDTEKSITDFRW